MLCKYSSVHITVVNMASLWWNQWLMFTFKIQWKWLALGNISSSHCDSISHGLRCFEAAAWELESKPSIDDNAAEQARRSLTNWLADYFNSRQFGFMVKDCCWNVNEHFVSLSVTGRKGQQATCKQKQVINKSIWNLATISDSHVRSMFLFIVKNPHLNALAEAIYLLSLVDSSLAQNIVHLNSTSQCFFLMTVLHFPMWLQQCHWLKQKFKSRCQSVV